MRWYPGVGVLVVVAVIGAPIALATGDDGTHAMAWPGQRFTGSVGVDQWTGSAYADDAAGRSGADMLRGGPGADAIDGGSGNDLIEGGDGRDRIDAGRGRDVLAGGNGNDILKAMDDDHAVDTVECGAGEDYVMAQRSDDIDDDCEKVRWFDPDTDGDGHVQATVYD